MRSMRNSGDVLEIALVNNMPDQALSATQAQFSRLVHAGAAGRACRWRCYTLPGVDRSETARRYLARTHEDIEALYRRGADALIVTGCEPRAARLDQEPFWPQMQTLVDWAATYTSSTIWSCLAAHAATLHLSGIERQRMPHKVSGVYTFDRAGADWAGEAAGANVVVPHSRYNGLAREALESKGFNIGACAAEVGVDMFWREEPSLFVFLQGHPEYDADTLLKEYRRDVLRFVSAERAEYPEQPENCFSDRATEALERLRSQVISGSCRDAGRRLADILSGESCEAVWAGHTARLYRDWLRVVSERAGAWRDTA